MILAWVIIIGRRTPITIKYIRIPSSFDSYTFKIVLGLLLESVQLK